MSSFIYTFANSYRMSTLLHLFLSELTDHELQKPGPTSCLGWRAMGRMLLEEYKLVGCQRSQLRNDACWFLWASLGTKATVSQLTL